MLSANHQRGTYFNSQPIIIKRFTCLLLATQLNSPASSWSGRLMLEETVIYCHFYSFHKKSLNIFSFLFKEIFSPLFGNEEGNLLIMIIPGGSFLFITLVPRGPEIPGFSEYLSSHDSVTI